MVACPWMVFTFVLPEGHNSHGRVMRGPSLRVPQRRTPHGARQAPSLCWRLPGRRLHGGTRCGRRRARQPRARWLAPEISWSTSSALRPQVGPAEKHVLCCIHNPCCSCLSSWRIIWTSMQVDFDPIKSGYAFAVRRHARSALGPAALCIAVGPHAASGPAAREGLCMVARQLPRSCPCTGERPRQGRRKARCGEAGSSCQEGAKGA
jgi:hypothetical protein